MAEELSRLHLVHDRIAGHLAELGGCLVSKVAHDGLSAQSPEQLEPELRPHQLAGLLKRGRLRACECRGMATERLKQRWPLSTGDKTSQPGKKTGTRPGPGDKGPDLKPAADHRDVMAALAAVCVYVCLATARAWGSNCAGTSCSWLSARLAARGVATERLRQRWPLSTGGKPLKMLEKKFGTRP